MANFVESDTMLMNDPLLSCEKLVVRGIGAKNGRTCAVRGKSMKLGVWLI